MTADERVAIALSRTKLVLLTLGAFLFVALGTWLIEIADVQRQYPPLYVKGAAWLAIGFFGPCGLYGLLKLLDRAPGFVLDREGLIDNSSGLAAGRVPWREIREIRIASERGQRFLALVVDDPEKYIRRGNALRRYAAGWNHRRYGTPVLISAIALKTSLEDLERQVRDFRGRHGSAESA